MRQPHQALDKLFDTEPHSDDRRAETVNGVLKYLAAYEGRSINREVLYLIRREIEVFEKEHGKIELPEE